MRVRLLAFASAADALGASERTLELPEGSRVVDLRTTLIDMAPGLDALWNRLAIAVDDEIVGPDCELAEGNEVALLPPVSGGSGRHPRVCLLEGPVPTESLVKEVSAPQNGAVVLFLGMVRGSTGDRPVRRLTYSAYRPLAEKTLKKIVEELETAHPGLRMAVHHRLGSAEVGEVSVGIAAASPHRNEAYEASRTALERLKKEAPIWKREEYLDGSAEWREEEPLEK